MQGGQLMNFPYGKLNIGRKSLQIFFQGNLLLHVNDSIYYKNKFIDLDERIHSLWQGELESKVTIIQHFPQNNSHIDIQMKIGSPNSAFLSCVSLLAFMLYSELTDIKHFKITYA